MTSNCRRARNSSSTLLLLLAALVKNTRVREAVWVPTASFRMVRLGFVAALCYWPRPHKEVDQVRLSLSGSFGGFEGRRLVKSVTEPG